MPGTGYNQLDDSVPSEMIVKRRRKGGNKMPKGIGYGKGGAKYKPKKETSMKKLTIKKRKR